jgi:hypothetical protein
VNKKECNNKDDLGSKREYKKESSQARRVNQNAKSKKLFNIKLTLVWYLITND